MNTDVNKPTVSDPEAEFIKRQNRQKRRVRPKRHIFVRILRSSLLIIVGTYLTILGVLLYNETELVYPGSRYPKGNWTPTAFEFEEIEFASQDGTRLVGWLLSAPLVSEFSTNAPADAAPALDPAVADQARETKQADTTAQTDATDVPNLASPPAPKPNQASHRSHRAVLLCHGNGENVAESSAWTGDYFRRYLDADVFVFDYRGFGKSEGVPDEPGLLADAESALQWLCERTGKQPNEVILVGHSLGGGPAVHLAKQHGCQALILQRTFSNLAEVGQASYPWLPVRYLMRNQYPSIEKITACDQPLFQSHGAADDLIPIQMAKELFEASPAKTKEFYEVPGMGHFDALPEDYWQTMRAFILKSESQAEAGS